jgi:hypothetical protein
MCLNELKIFSILVSQSKIIPCPKRTVVHSSLRQIRWVHVPISKWSQSSRSTEPVHPEVLLTWPRKRTLERRQTNQGKPKSWWNGKNKISKQQIGSTDSLPEQYSLPFSSYARHWAFFIESSKVRFFASKQLLVI